MNLPPVSSISASVVLRHIYMYSDIERTYDIGMHSIKEKDIESSGGTDIHGFKFDVICRYLISIILEQNLYDRFT